MGSYADYYGIKLPAANEVLAGIQFGWAGTEFTGTLSGGGGGTYTAAANVRFGTDRGDGIVGTLLVPTSNQVLLGVGIDSTTGTVRVPPVGKVEAGYSYGASDSLVGTLTGGGDATLEAIMAKLDAIKGPGDHTWSIAVRTAGDAPIAGCDCWVTADQAGLNAITDIQRTDANGVVAFLLDPGTYYLFRRKSGVTFSNPQSFTVT